MGESVVDTKDGLMDESPQNEMTSGAIRSRG